MKNVFFRTYGSLVLSKPLYFLLIVVVSLVISYFIGKSGITGSMFLIIGLIAVSYVTAVVRKPIVILLTIVGVSFFLLGITRYVKMDFPIGTLIDLLIVFTLLALFINSYPKGIDWSPTKKPLIYFSLVWLIYCIGQIANPEARSFDAWMSSIRPMAVYPLILPIFGIFFFNTPSRIRLFLYVWGFFSVIGTLKGWGQLAFGLDHAEQAWIDAGAWDTHLIFGKLRVFSFYSDAGQFGAHQAYTGVVFLAMAIISKRPIDKILFVLISIAGLYGMLISGTRGALFVVFAGVGLYVLHKKNLVVLSFGFVFVVALFVFLKYTSIGQGNPQISRLRTAVDPNDASLQARLSNQRMLSVYMSTRPIGGGLGHGGKKARKFLPAAYLSNVPTDSWYVLVWVELGVVGLVMHLFINLHTVTLSSYVLMYKIRDKELVGILSGFAAGMFGVMVASYGNAVIWQLPTSQTFYPAMGILVNAKNIDRNIRISKIKSRRVTKYRHRMKNCRVQSLRLIN